MTAVAWSSVMMPHGWRRQEPCHCHVNCPLQSEPFEDQGVNVFFGGLLPEADAIGNPLALPELQNEIIRHRVTQRAEKMLEHLDKIKGEVSRH